MPLSPFACSHCGHWQLYFAVPPHCPVCSDVRNDLPADGWDFRTPAQLMPTLQFHAREAMPGIWDFWSTPPFGLGSHGWLLLHPDGNVAFEAAPLYNPAQLDQIRALGGIRFLSASHPHGYGALFQLQEAFQPEALLIQKDDLDWTKAFRVTLPYDDTYELYPGLTLHHVGGHTAGQAVLHDEARRAIFAGDSMKIDFDAYGAASGISCHKAYHKQIPLSRAEAMRYRSVYQRLDFTSVFTPFEMAAGIGTQAALALLDRVIEGPPFTTPIPIPR